MQENTPQGGRELGQGQNGKPTLSWSQPQGAGAAPAKPVSQPQSGMKMGGPEKSTVGAYVGVFVGGLIVGILIGWGVAGVHSNSGSETAGTMTGTSTATNPGTTAETGTTTMNLSGSTIGADQLAIPSPQNAGLEVAVSHVSVMVPTWVVVYEDQDGLPGNALGAELFYPASQGGETSGAVELLRGTLPGQTYLVGEALDDGDHIFSLSTDKPVRDANGNPVFTSFKTN